MKIGFFQPQKLGDIIICAPIADHYIRQYNCNITWPVLRGYIPSLSSFNPRINFIGIDGEPHNSANNVRQELSGCDMIVDIMFGFVDSNPDNNSKYVCQNQYSFDEYKYVLSNVPFNEKWNLTIQRDHKRETDLYNRLVKTKDYGVCHFQASDRKRTHQCNASQVIEITNQTDNIFDWLTIIENAKHLVMIDSCFANLVDQLKMKNRKTLLYKQGYYTDKLTDGRFKGLPLFRETWEIVK